MSHEWSLIPVQIPVKRAAGKTLPQPLAGFPCVFAEAELLPFQRPAVPAGGGVCLSIGCRQSHPQCALRQGAWHSSPGDIRGHDSGHWVPPSAGKSSGLFLLCCFHVLSSASPLMSWTSTPALSCMVRSLHSLLGIFLITPFLCDASVLQAAPTQVWQVGQARTC